MFVAFHDAGLYGVTVDVLDVIITAPEAFMCP